MQPITPHDWIPGALSAFVLLMLARLIDYLYNLSTAKRSKESRLDHTAISLIEKMQTRIDTLEDRLNKLEADHLQDQTIIIGLRTQVEQLKREKAELELDMTQNLEVYKRKVEELRAHIETLERQIINLGGTVIPRN